MAVDFTVELQSKVKDFCEANFVQLWMRDSRSISAAAKRVPKRAAVTNPALKYYNLKYACIHGGQAFRPKGTGLKQTR